MREWQFRVVTGGCWLMFLGFLVGVFVGIGLMHYHPELVNWLFDPMPKLF
jgi:hypothetical protein